MSSLFKIKRNTFPYIYIFKMKQWWMLLFAVPVLSVYVRCLSSMHRKIRPIPRYMCWYPLLLKPSVSKAKKASSLTRALLLLETSDQITVAQSREWSDLWNMIGNWLLRLNIDSMQGASTVFSRAWPNTLITIPIVLPDNIDFIYHIVCSSF